MNLGRERGGKSHRPSQAADINRKILFQFIVTYEFYRGLPVNYFPKTFKIMLGGNPRRMTTFGGQEIPVDGL